MRCRYVVLPVWRLWAALVLLLFLPNPGWAQPTGEQSPKAPQWSQEVGGLRVRLLRAYEGGYGQAMVFAQLANTSDQLLKVPFADDCLAVCGETLRLQMRSFDGPWKDIESQPKRRHITGSGEPKAGALVLNPGQSALLQVFLSDTWLPDSASYLRVIVRHEEAPRGWNGWKGTLTTPGIPARRTERQIGPLRGTLSLPERIPDFGNWAIPSPCGWLGLEEDRLSLIWRSNWQMLETLRLFRKDQVRRLFEEKLQHAADDQTPLLSLLVAARTGSSRAVANLRRMSKSTDYETARTYHSLLVKLLSHYQEDAPRWLGRMVAGVVEDNRIVTGTEEMPWGEVQMSIFALADEESLLIWRIGSARVRQATEALIRRVEKKPDRATIRALGDLGDARAVPVLLKMLREMTPETEGAERKAPAHFEAVADALVALKATQALPHLEEFLHLPSCVSAYARLGGPDTVPLLRRIARKEGQLKRNGDPKHSEKRLFQVRVELALLSEDPVAEADAWASDPTNPLLWRLKGPETVPLLLDTIRRSESGSSTWLAISRLSHLPIQGYTQDLIACMKLDFSTRQACKAGIVHGYGRKIADVLREHTGQPFGPDADQWNRWWQNRKEP